MIALGIDSGLDGALALVNGHGKLLELARMPVRDNGRPNATVKREVDPHELRRLLLDWRRRHLFASDVWHIVAERVDPVNAAGGPERSGAVTALAKGRAAGTVLGVASGIAGAEYSEVGAREWKRFFGLASDKAASKACAVRLYGEQLPRVFSHDKAEALLIAHWALKTLA